MVQMMFWTDDPVDDFHRWDAEQAKELAKLPVCADCGDPIQDDQFYLFRGERICIKCMDSYKVWTDEFCNDGV